MISDVLKKCLLDKQFVWDGDRKYSRVQNISLVNNQAVIVNGQLVHQEPQQARLVLTVEDYGQSCVSNLDDTDKQLFNFVAFRQEVTVEGTNEQNCTEDIVSFRDFEENLISEVVQRFLFSN